MDLLDDRVNVEITMSEDSSPIIQKENLELKTEIETNETTELESIEHNHLKVSFTCLKCKYIGESFEGLNKHMKSKHVLGSNKKKRKPSKIKPAKDDKKNEGTNKCSQCKYIGSNNHDLVRHIKRKHILRMNVEKDEDDHYRCKHCDYKTPRLMNLHHHLQIHEGILHNCSQCEYKSYSEYNLRKHIKRSHGVREKTFVCEKCSYSSGDVNMLTKHNKSVHDIIAKEIRYMCDKCSYKTHSTNNFNNHMQIHANTIHFCDQCIYSTPSAYNLKKHMKRMHDNDNLVKLKN